MSFKKAMLLSVARCDGIIQRHKNSCAGLYYIYKKNTANLRHRGIKRLHDKQVENLT